MRAIRDAVGRDFVLGLRLPGDEFIEGGLVLEHTLATAGLLDRDGLLDYFNTSIGTATHTLFMVEGSMHLPPGYQLFTAAALRRVTSLPVVGVGRIKDPIQAERALATGQCDLVGMVRQQQQVQPDLPPWREIPRGGMRVAIAQQKKRLEEQDGGSPDSGGAAEP